MWYMLLLTSLLIRADLPEIVTEIEAQPLTAQVQRLLQALDFLGRPLDANSRQAVEKAIVQRDVSALQKSLDSHALLVVNINPEARVKVAKGPATVSLQQAGYTPVLIKVINESTVKKPLRISSPQAGTVYSGAGRNERAPDADSKIVQRFAELEMYTAPPMTAELSGLKVEYAIALIYSSEAGKREITISFDIGQGTQDLGFRAEVPVLFDIKPAIPVNIRIADVDGVPTVGRFTFKDKQGHIYPPQAKRLRPDLFFQQQIYRADGGTVLLPPGEFRVEYGRGPEYDLKTMNFTVKADQSRQELAVKLSRWINPADFGYYSGDHHIHAAGCAHYTNPTEGIFPEDMFLHVKGEALNVGCCLTWGPCYNFQRRFFASEPWEKSEPFTVLKYDVEVSGFGSQAMGHVCLLNLKDQTYPGSDGTKTRGWPTWTTPLMRWAKAQGGVTGYAHSANGLGVHTEKSTRRLMQLLDQKKQGYFTQADASSARWPLPESFEKVDADSDGQVTERELMQSTRRISTQLPNLVIPEMNGIGAQEICVTTALGVCDFISAMDTERVPEWNCWYHLLNCGFPLKVSGETDFPCITGGRVGQGRVYVHLGKVSSVNFADWCQGIAKGQSYVSDGYAHAFDFELGGVALGMGEKHIAFPGTVHGKAKVAFQADMPLGTAVGGRVVNSKERTVELIENGHVIARHVVPADGKVHDVAFDIPVKISSWYALRCYPQLHTNPINVIVGKKPIRASKESAKWCIGVIEQLWVVREKDIKEEERPAARKAFDEALAIYHKIVADAE